MCPGVMDKEIIAHIYLREHSVHCKLVVVLTERPRHVIFVCARFIFFPQDGNMMICTVHSRTHQIDRTGICTDIFFVSMLFMDRFCHQTAIWPQHITSKFGVNLHVAHSCRNQHFLIYPAHALADGINIIWLLIRSVRDAYSPG